MSELANEKKRCIGPDLRTLGVSNYNNSILVSQELLDKYTSAYTSSETSAGAHMQTVLGDESKFIQDALQPPTTLSSHSLVRGKLDYTRQQQLLPDALLCRRLRAVLEGPDFAPSWRTSRRNWVVTRCPLSSNVATDASPTQARHPRIRSPPPRLPGLSFNIRPWRTNLP